MNTDDDNEEVRYHDSLPGLTYNTKKGILSNLMPTLGLEDFTKGNTYRAGLIELIGSIQFVLGSCLIANGVSRTGVAYPIVYIAILHIFLFMFMISSTIPGSGGHLNPLISMACVCARVMSISRCVVYVVCQVIGATIAGFLVRIMVGEDVAQTYGIGQCGLGNYVNEVGIIPAFLIEFVFDFILLFVCYGMVLDPKQGEVAGPIFGPLAVSLIFCFNFVVSGLIRPNAGYSGAAMNPSRCLGPALAMFNIDYMWVWWTAAQFAAVIHGALYILVPPYHANLYGKLETKRKKQETQS
jgi:glycerol uptake facilitator-like aquaporin